LPSWRHYDEMRRDGYCIGADNLMRSTPVREIKV